MEKNIPDNNGLFYRPCVNCGNIKKCLKEEIVYHLCCDGICQNYTTWTWLGEVDKN